MGAERKGPARAGKVGGDVAPERQGQLLGLVVGENNDARRCLTTTNGVEVRGHEYEARRLDLV
jgi:hypothetical protein